MTVVEETSKRQEGRGEKGNKMKDQRESEIVVVVVVVMVVGGSGRLVSRNGDGGWVEG